MYLSDLSNAELNQKLDQLCSVYLASCELDYDCEHLEQQLDDAYAEAESRGHF